jgi:ureidoglycolate hydrolase
METIEEYEHIGQGYNPFLIRGRWQVAQLNYHPRLAFDAIDRVERHKATDEVFISFRGRPVLIGAVEEAGALRLERCAMRPGVTYNIPAGVWHAIAMRAEDVVLIVEDANTHLHDVEYRPLDENESGKLTGLLNEATAPAR